MDESVTIDVDFYVADPKLAREEALYRGLMAFEPKRSDALQVTYLSDGKNIGLLGWRFTASVTWTPEAPF